MADVLRALMVDDDEDEFVLARRLLQRSASDVELTWASGYHEGLRELRSGAYHAALVDYRMGERDGLLFIREAMAQGSTTPLILLTGVEDRALDLRALHEGAADYLDKRQMTGPLLERTLRYAVERARRSEAQEALASARRIEEFQRQLLAMVGHDLQNPLTAISLSLERLARSPESSEAIRDVAARGAASCRRMDRIIGDIADFTKARLGRGLSLSPRATSVEEVVATVLGEIAQAHPGRTIEREGRGDAKGVWDPARLGQVVQNLVGNALKYGDSRKPVRVRWWREDDGALHLEVHNEGTPIPPELQIEIFQPFARPGSDHAGNSRSFGLGLFIVQEIAQAHGGSVRVTSTCDAGTTFTVRLPVQEPP